MKVTLDLTKLLDEGRISQAEVEKLSQLSAHATGSLAFNILVGFGVIAVSGATLALVPTPSTSVILELIVSAAGITLIQARSQQRAALANICTLAGALLFGGGLVTLGEGSVGSFLLVSAVFSATGIATRSALPIALAVLSLSSCVGARTGYLHATYFLGIEEPGITVLLFSLLCIGFYQVSKRLSADFERLALAGARTSVFLVNFGFWIGSLWGDKISQNLVVPDWLFAVLWAAALIAAGLWAVKQNKRWVLNIVAVFGAIHFYTQWFERLGATPATVLVAGLLALGLAIGLWSSNRRASKSA